MTADAFDHKSFVSALPHEPGVYRMLAADGAVLYVGKAKDLKKRVASYFSKGGHSPRIALMLQQVAAMETTATRSEAEALILENTLIKQLKPKYNILFRDDKSFPYIALSAGDFPRLFHHRGAFARGVRYFGPYPGGGAVHESIRLLQKTFLLRTCEEAVFAHRSRPCLLHQIQRCKAPCVGLVDEAQYAADVRLATLFLNGRHGEVIEKLTGDMETASAQLKFEQAAAVRDQIRALQSVLHRQYVSSPLAADVDIVVAAATAEDFCVNLAMVRGGLHLGDRACFPRRLATSSVEAEEGLAAFLAQHYAERPAPPRLLLAPWPLRDETPAGLNCDTPRNAMERAWLEMAQNNAQLALAARRKAQSRATTRLEALRAALGLADAPRRIECFDISHTMGEGTVASCVVCVDGVMKKSDYRRFNISGIVGGDDYAAMRQALSRRYSKLIAGDASPPDLVLIDGGKGQHAAARAVFDELGLGEMASIGVAKGEARRPGAETLWLHNSAQPLHLAMENPGFLLIQEIRDEAHRFAIVAHRARRSKARGASALESVEGVGPTRRRRLLAHFGGLDGVRAATVDDLCRVAGVSRRLAEQIHRQLR